MPRLPLSFLIIIALSGVAAARPFTVVARYGPSAKEITASISVVPGAAIPEGGNGAPLQDLAIRLDDKPFGLAPATAFREIVATVTINEVRFPPVKLTGAKDGSVTQLLLWKREHGTELVVSHVEVTIQAQLHRELLCMAEIRLRDKEGVSWAPEGATALEQQSAVAPPKIYKKAPARRLVHYKKTLYATNCGWEGNTDPVSWGEAMARAKAENELGDQSTEELRDVQTVILEKRVRAELEKYVTPWSTVEDAPPGNLEESVGFEVFRTGAIFNPYEFRPDHVVDLAGTVDIDSQISFAAANDSGYCPPVQAKPFRYELQEPGDDKTKVAITPRFIESCEFVLPIDLSKFRNKRLVVRAIYDADDGKQLVLYERDFSVREVGFTWTAPVLTEVKAAFSGWSKDQMRAQSSIPLSYAVGLSKGAGNGVAVTFPWKITYATRNNPTLSEMIAVYPHLSVLVTETDVDETPVTFAAGVGVALVGAFHFSYALGFKGPHDGQHYMLIGIDIKDLAGLKPSL